MGPSLTLLDIHCGEHFCNAVQLLNIACYASHLRSEFRVRGELLQLFQQGIVELVLVKLEQLFHEAGISQLLFGLIPSGRLLEDCHDSR